MKPKIILIITPSPTATRNPQKSSGTIKAFPSDTAMATTLIREKRSVYGG